MTIMRAILILSVAIVSFSSPSGASDLKGDINSDGTVSLNDTIVSLQIISRNSELAFDLSKDVNSDKKIGIEEAIYSLQVISGLRQLQYIPIARDGFLETEVNTEATGILIATDGNNTPLSYSIISNGYKGLATITDKCSGTFSYLPNDNAIGADSFTFIANDGEDNSNIATVKVTIKQPQTSP